VSAWSADQTAVARTNVRRLLLGEIAVLQFLRKGRPAPRSVMRWQGALHTIGRVSVRDKRGAARRLLPHIRELLSLRASLARTRP
jgi:hypothetical protein